MRTYTRKRPNHQLIENVHELCRLCLCKADGVVPIFTEDTNNVCAVLALRIMICVGLEMKREDCLPNLICTECLNSLNKYYAFRKKCEVSYQKLKSHVLAVKEKQYKLKIEEQNEAKKNKNAATTESDEDMKFVVTFEKDQVAKVSMLNLNDVASVNNFKGKITDLTKAEATGVPLPNREVQMQGFDTQEPDITTFLSTMLLQLGILTQQDSGVIFTEQSINTLELETGDGSQVTFELVEEDEQEQIMEESVVVEHPIDPTDESNTSEQNNVVIKYVTSNYNTPRAAEPTEPTEFTEFVEPIEVAKKNKVIDCKKNSAWCDQCGKQLASRSALNRHRRIHSGEKPYPCPHCGRKFSQREIMLRHALVHVEQRPYACAWCPKSFTQRGALQAHERAHAPPHARALAIHRCSRCPKVFLYASGLSRHMMMHAGRVYVCGACERQFKDKSSLMRHLKNANHSAADDSTT